MSKLITNRFNLPTPMFRALSLDTYKGGGDISVTRLIAPPRQVALRKHHADEITEDASDRIWSLLGQAVHVILERSAEEGTEVETRLKMDILGWTLTGQPDIMEKATISDYKVTSVAVLGFDKPEWEQQINLQAMLHRHHGDEIYNTRIIAILRDWSKRKSKYEKDYPPCAVQVISFPTWEQTRAIAFAQERMGLHQRAWKAFVKSKYDPNSLPLCTPEERWHRGHAFAVKKMDIKTGKVNKKSDRLLLTREAAEKFIQDNTPTLPKNKKFAPIQERPGEDVRCMDFCDVGPFCPHYRQLVALRDLAAGPAESDDNED